MRETRLSKFRLSQSDGIMTALIGLLRNEGCDKI